MKPWISVKKGLASAADLFERKPAEAIKRMLDLFLYLLLIVAIFLGCLMTRNYMENTFENSKHIQIMTFYESANKEQQDLWRDIQLEKDNNARTLDLINLVIVSCGVLIALISIIAIFQVRRWESAHEDTNKKLKDAEEKYKELEEFKVKLEEIANQANHKTEVTMDILDKYATHFTRGLSKYYSDNYHAAIGEFEKVISEYNTTILPLLATEHFKLRFTLSDIYFYIAKSYFRLIPYSDYSFNEDTIQILDKIINNSSEAIKGFELQSADSNKANTIAYSGIAVAYKINNDKLSKADKENLKSEAINLANIALDTVRDSALYNVACIYAVLFTYEKNKTQRKSLLKKSIDYLREAYNNKIIDKDYIIEDEDWSRILDPLPFNDELNPRTEILKVIGKTFKRTPEYHISKLYMRLYENTKIEDYKENAYKLLKRCKECNVIVDEQIISSNLWKKYKDELKLKQIIS